ncbi:MAG: hypothetical protein JO303_00805 [Caulobacteraceae bacterium]|nr:hypothetical protein [Caulobacteraceae bacterium]
MSTSDQRRIVWLLIGAVFALAGLTAAVAGVRLGLFQPPPKPDLPTARLAPPIVESVDVRAVPEAGESMGALIGRRR